MLSLGAYLLGAALIWSARGPGIVGTFLLTQALDSAAVYEEVTRSGVLRITPVAEGNRDS